MAPNLNNAAVNAHTGVAWYLFGVGPMPLSTPQDLALAHLHRALDEGAFEHPWNVNTLFQVTHPRPFSQKWLHI